MRVAIIGAGTMGAGIAQACLAAGHDVHLHDVAPLALERGRERIEAGLARRRARGRLSEDQARDALDRLTLGASLAEAAAEAEIVIEAAPEDADLKHDLFTQLDGLAPPPALLASNTSALSITTLAEATAYPNRVLGLHFFNPAPRMRLVEVVAGERTDAATLSAGRVFIAGLDKQPVLCADAPGFIVNRVNRPFTIEPLRMLEAGEASIEAIDRAIAGAGYPMGPFAYMDFVGIDVNLAAARAVWAGFDEAERFRPSGIQEALVAAGALGRKTGAGFYAYNADDPPTAPNPELERLIGSAAGELEAARIVERVELTVVNEAYFAAGEGVAGPRDIDLALKLGANHPLGPFERAGQLGLRHVVEGLARLQSAHGERFAVAPALWQIANA
ncbi:MAG TPA: 3-hydroxyacyl-CoA dehydrogenase NAD-binding domain-containing protein [Candidatus Limnocylindrales bacterium]|nr:3-hydroxyacyl-CoA dehydrogenase NAD-binding domain-containing protein [Candidatus Limnocylindrales bacterium]